jgi:hypothetical protein
MLQQYRPRLFVGSSSEGLSIAKAVQANLELRNFVVVKLWSEGLFALGDFTADTLGHTAATFDFAVLVFSPDDISTSRGDERFAPRDNVVFELGLFAGHLGRERTFLVVDEVEKPKVPSDFAGVTFATYTVFEDAPGKVKIDVDRACGQIETAVKALGKLRHPELEPTLYSIVRNTRKAFKVDHPLFQNQLARWYQSEKKESEVWGEGLLRISMDYQFFLANVYKKAEKSIFSATVPEYSRKVWLSPSDALGKRLLRAQQENKKAKSTRVFAYSGTAEISEHDVRIMKLHKEYGIEVLVYIDAVYPGFIYEPDTIDKDWNLIDDVAVGVTKAIEPKKREAYWYFDNPELASQYRELRDGLLDLSVPLDEFLADFPTQQKLA